MSKIPWRNFIFAKLFITFIIIIFPIILIGFLLYNWGINTVKTDTMASMTIQTSFYRENFEKEIQRIRLQQIAILNDDSLSMLAASPSVMGNYERDKAMLNAQQRLYAIKNSSRYISDVSALLPQADCVISTTSFDVMGQTDYDMIVSYAASVDNLFQFTDHNLYLTAEFPYMVKNDTALPMAMLSIKLSTGEIIKMLAELGTEPSSGALFFENRQGTVICDSMATPLAMEIMKAVKSNRASISADRQMQLSSGSLAAEIDGVSYLITYSSSGYLDSTLARYIPERLIFQKVNQYRSWLWFFSITTVVVIIAFSASTYRFIHRPVSILAGAFSKVETGNMDFEVVHRHKDEFKYIYERFNSMLKNLMKLIDQAYVQKILVQKAELKQLQTQINPHFLYNSFFILHRWIKEGYKDGAILLSSQLGTYFQFLTRNSSDEVPLSMEFEHARTYVDIQAIRFSKRLTFHFQDLEAVHGNIMVPRLILQPIIENAFNHGLEKMESGMVLSVSFICGGRYLDIIVEDNGSMLEDSEIERMKQALTDESDGSEITGMINIHKRICSRFGGQCGLVLERSALSGLKVTIRIDAGGSVA